jgi:hypothetical protein
MNEIELEQSELKSLEEMHALALAVELGINNYSRVVRNARKALDESPFEDSPPES